MLFFSVIFKVAKFSVWFSATDFHSVWKLEQLWKSPHIISIATKVKLFNTTCVTILLYGCESWVISQDMENKINAFATSCYRVMLNIKRIDHVLNTTVYSMTNTVPLIHLVRYRQLKFLGHILRMSKEEPARRFALYIPTIGKRRPGRSRTLYLNYVQRFLGDNEGAMQEQQIAAFADDRHGETLWSSALQPMDDDDDDDHYRNMKQLHLPVIQSMIIIEAKSSGLFWKKYLWQKSGGTFGKI